MPRPKVDEEAISLRLLIEAEHLLKENGGRRLILSDVASRAGMSQSYAHRFFATKADLVRALAQRWFYKVEAVSQEAAHSTETPELRLENWLLGILRAKRDAYDADPALFGAYLEMASGHMDIVMHHVQQLQRDLRHILSDMNLSCHLEKAIELVEDATLLFRTPHNIALYRSQATNERAKAVVHLLIDQIKQ